MSEINKDDHFSQTHHGHLGVQKDSSQNYFRFVWDDDEEAADVPTPPQNRRFPELFPDYANTFNDLPASQNNASSNLSQPILDMNNRNTTNYLRNVTSTEIALPGEKSSSSGTNTGGLVLGVSANTMEATYSKKDGQEQSKQLLSYPHLAASDDESKSRLTSPLRPRGRYDPSREPLRPNRPKPSSKALADVETTHVSLLSDDENILAADDAEINSPFTPENSAILATSGRPWENKRKRRKMIIWGLIIGAAFIVGGLITYLSVRAIHGW